ncbi:MAG: DegV family protein [Caldilineaceae bacterium]|nr:DegV family protein [Caldilineaceae bacterium]
MSKVHIVTDSNAFLRPEVAERYNIKVLPQRLKVGGAYFEESEALDVDEMFVKVQEIQAGGAKQMPVVQPPDLNTVLDCYQSFGHEAEQIVSIHMSGELSPTWKVARQAAELLKGRYTIRVIDSLSTSYGLGLLVEKAAQVAAEGASVSEIARFVNGAIPHLYVTSFSESLNYLERSAQISPSQSILGAMLGIKAMIIMEEGQLMALEKVQTHEEVVDKLYEFISEFAGLEEIGIFQHQYEDVQETLIERLKEDTRIASIPLHRLPYAPSLAAYLGPNTMGVVVYEGLY